GVILHAEHRMVAMAETLQRLVVQIRVSDLDFVEVQRFGIDCEAVVVRRDLDASGNLVEHRMIRAAMAELQLERLSTERESGDLLTQTDAEDRHAPDKFANLRDLKFERLRIPGSVREKHTIRLQREHIFGGRPGGNHRKSAPYMHQAAQNVPLDAEIVR